MSLSRKIGIISALAVSGVILFQGIASRESLVDGKVEAQSSQLAETSTLQSQRAAFQMKGAKSTEELKAFLQTQFEGLNVSNIRKSPIEGYYEVFYDNEMLYLSANGQFMFTGSMIELGKDFPINHTQRAIAEADNLKAPMRAKLIADIEEKDMVVFKAKDEKHVVTVFTDVDCAYCRKLHKDMPQLNASGITVRYMAYPRAGIGSGAYQKLVSIWCSDDKLAAMDEAKLNRKFGNDSCKNPVADQFNLVRKLSLSGTPAVITNSGEVIGGYLPAEDMLGLLNSRYADAASNETSNQSGR